MEISKNNRFLFHVSKHSKDMLRQNVRILRADLTSTVFKNAGQKQSQPDHLHSAFHLIQVRTGTFSNPLSTNPLRQFF